MEEREFYMARVRKNKRGIVGINWHLKLRLKIETLETSNADLISRVKTLEDA